MIPSESRPDVVIVGAGIAGSALAISLAGSGHSVTLLEKSTVHVGFAANSLCRGAWLRPKRSGFSMFWRAPAETTRSGRFHTARSFRRRTLENIRFQWIRWFRVSEAP